jgi:protein-S-isoprenylcysteine O-methyltransferase Ste14
LPGDVKENILEVRGTYGINGDEDPSLLHDHNILAKPDSSRRVLQVGERGEQYVVAQFSLFLFIAIGGLPLVGDAVLPILGPTLIFSGLFMVYRSAVDLEYNLSPWPVPTQSGRGSIVDGGIYSYIRHPMYAGSLLGMAGLGLITDSATRLFLTVLLYFVLDAKSDYEETKLMEKFGSKYKV